MTHNSGISPLAEGRLGPLVPIFETQTLYFPLIRLFILDHINYPLDGFNNTPPPPPPPPPVTITITRVNSGTA